MLVMIAARKSTGGRRTRSGFIHDAPVLKIMSMHRLASGTPSALPRGSCSDSCDGAAPYREHHRTSESLFNTKIRWRVYNQLTAQRPPTPCSSCCRGRQQRGGGEHGYRLHESAENNRWIVGPGTRCTIFIGRAPPAIAFLVISRGCPCPWS